MSFLKSMRVRHAQWKNRGKDLADLSVPQQSLNAAKTLRSFSSAKAGNVSILFGLMIVPFVSFAGMSIDFAAASREKTIIQAALDSAALAAGRAYQASDGDVGAAKAAAALYFERQTGYELSVNDVDPASYVLTVGAQERIKTAFMGVLGDSYRTLTVSAESKAQLVADTQGDLVEVAMMLDVTGSMAGSRIADLKSAATDLVTILIRDGEDHTRIGLAPFSHAVNVGPHFNAMTNKNPVGGNTCVVERTGNKKYKDHRPSANNGYFEVFPASGGYWTCPAAELVPLTSNKQLLFDEIDDLPTHGNTAGHLGTAWAWYLVSKKWSNMFAPERSPSNTNDGVKKIVVLMSDGSYNQYWNNPDNSDTQAKKICNQMNKVAHGITVYSIGFGLSPGSTPYNRLKDCATEDENDKYFFPAANGEELRAAFRSIAFSIAALRLIQ